MDGGDGQRPDGGRGCPQLLRQSHGSVGQIPDEMGGGGKLLLPGAVMEGRVPDGDLDAPGVQSLPPQPGGHGVRQNGDA